MNFVTQGAGGTNGRNRFLPEQKHLMGVSHAHLCTEICMTIPCECPDFDRIGPFKFLMAGNFVYLNTSSRQ